MATDRPAKTEVNSRQAGPDIKQILANLRKSPKAKQKKVSPKSRRTAELYKSSHNIGNRTAAERVGSYKESEVALVYPEGFWDVAQYEQEEDPEIASDSEVSKEVKEVEMGRRSASASPAKLAKSDASLKELKVVLDKKQANAKETKGMKKDSPKKKQDDKAKKDDKIKKDDKTKKEDKTKKDNKEKKKDGSKEKKVTQEDKTSGPKESPKKSKKDETKSPKKVVSKSSSPAKGKQSNKSAANDTDKKQKETKTKKKKSKVSKKATQAEKKDDAEVVSIDIDTDEESDDKNSDTAKKVKRKKKKKKKEGDSSDDGKKTKKLKAKGESEGKEKTKKVKKEKKVSTKAVKKSEKGKKVQTSKDDDKKADKKDKTAKDDKKGKEKDDKMTDVKKSAKDKTSAEKKGGKGAKQDKKKLESTDNKKKAESTDKGKGTKPGKAAKGKDKKAANSKAASKKSPVKHEIKRERSVSPASSTSSEESLSSLPSAYAVLGKRAASRTPEVRPRAPRIRRTACLNANAINSLLYENDDPSPKRAKFDSDESTTMETSGEDTKASKSPAKQKKLSGSPRKQDSVAKEKAEAKKGSAKKEKGKKQKGSKKPNKKATGNRVKKKPDNKKSKKQEESSDESSTDESDDEEEELRRKRKAEEDIPLWPPPKRMASLNAQAILAASKEPYRRVKVEKQSKPEAEENKVEKSKESEPVTPSKPAEEPKKSAPKEVKENEKKKAEVLPMRVPPATNKPVSPDVQIVMEQRNLPLPTQSPDVQIIEVRSPQAPPTTQRVPPYFSGNNSRSPGSSIQPQPGPLHPQPYPLPTNNMGHYQQQPPRSHYSYPTQAMQGSAYASPPAHHSPHMQSQHYDPMPPPPSNSHYQFSSQGGPQYQRPYSGPAAAPMESPRPGQHLGAAPTAHSKAFSTDGPSTYPGVPHPTYPQQQQQQLRLQSSPTSPFQPTQPGGLGALKPLESPANNSMAGSPFHAPSTASSSSSASSQLMPQNYSQQEQQEHGYAHRSSPMGNTCTYPYPHSNGMVQQQPSHMEQYQGMPHFSAMNAMSSYQMMACHRPYGSAFSMPAFPPHLGYLQGGEEMMSGGQDMCCMQSPFSYHVHQQQVKVLVHNPGGAFHTHHHHHHHHHPLDKDGMGKELKLGPGSPMPSIHPPSRPEPSGYYPEGYGPPRLKGKSHSSSGDLHHQQGVRSRQQPRGIGPPPPPDREQSHSSHHISSRRLRTSAGSKRQSDPETDRSVSSESRLQSDQPTLLDLDAYKAERFRVPKSEKHSPTNNNANKFSRGDKGSEYASDKSSRSKSDKSNIKSEKVNSRTDRHVNSTHLSAESANSSRTPVIIDDSINNERPQIVKSDRSPSVKSDKSSVRSSSVKSDRSGSRPPSVKAEKNNNGSRPPSVKPDKNNGSKTVEKSVTKNGKSDENSNDLTNAVKKDKLLPKINKSPKPANGKVTAKIPLKTTTGKSDKVVPVPVKTVTGKNDKVLSMPIKNATGKSDKVVLVEYKPPSKTDSKNSKTDKSGGDSKNAKTDKSGGDSKNAKIDKSGNDSKNAKIDKSGNDSKNAKTDKSGSDSKSAKIDKSSGVKLEGSNKGDESAQAQKDKSLRLEVRISKLDQGPEVREKVSPRLKDKADKVSPKQKPAEAPKKEPAKRKPIPCKWHWQGEPKTKRVFNPALEGQMVERQCYPAIQHADGDIIKVRDTVLVCSGPKKTDIPYVAKIAALWERENSPGEMMMSVVWYYRPEHTEMEPEKVPKHIPCEIFASKHKDETPVACIEDKCHVLTFSEYCRFRAMIQRKNEGLPISSKVVPQLPENEVTRRHRFPPLNASPETVFLCRKVYDFKLKRVLKNPAPA